MILREAFTGHVQESESGHLGLNAQEFRPVAAAERAHPAAEPHSRLNRSTGTSRPHVPP